MAKKIIKNILFLWFLAMFPSILILYGMDSGAINPNYTAQLICLTIFTTPFAIAVIAVLVDMYCMFMDYSKVK